MTGRLNVLVGQVTNNSPWLMIKPGTHKACFCRGGVFKEVHVYMSKSITATTPTLHHASERTVRTNDAVMWAELLF